MKRICVVQPTLSQYSLPVFVELSGNCAVDLIYSVAGSEKGFGDLQLTTTPAIRYFQLPTVRPLRNDWAIVQLGLLKYLVTQRPDAVLATANPRYLSFWWMLVGARLLGVPIFAHGHGLYKKRRIGFLYRAMVTAMLRLVTSYICYAPAVRQSFLDHGFSAGKLTVAHNSMHNQFRVLPKEKSGRETDVLFLGRLRADSNLVLLINAVERIRTQDGLPLQLHVIGGGELGEQLRQQATTRPWLVLHGQIYDQQQIRDISRNCLVGCYPGNVGLSLLHLWSLSLPVITHDNLRAHGPEASFICHRVNGVLFDHRKPQESLYQNLRQLAVDPAQILSMRRAAFEEYERLTNPSLAARLWHIISSNMLSVQGRVPEGFQSSSL